MIKASEFCKRVFDGTHDTPKPVSNGYKLLTSKHIMNNYLDTDSAYYISEEDYNEINKRSQVRKWDVLFSMIGSVGAVYLVTEDKIDFAIKNMGVFSCEEEYRAKWLFFYLQSPYAQNIIRNYLNGAVQKFIPLGMLRDFPIPEMEKKDKQVVDLLWEINQKMINNDAICFELEEMAKTIYDYWFLQFEFPNEEGKPYKTSGGKMVWNEELKRKIPYMWTCGQVCDLGEIVAGGTPSTKHDDYYTKYGIAWITPYDLSNTNDKYIAHGERDITEKGLRNSSAKLMPKGTVLLTSRAPIGYLGIAVNELCTNQGFKSIVPNEKYGSEFIYYTIYSMLPLIKSLGTGSTFTEISKEVVSNIKIVLPNQNVIRAFEKVVQPMAQQREILEKENQELTSLRDFLLPLLMNGQVSFKE